MIVKRPSIYIYTNDPGKDLLREICAGIEEEGVYYEVFNRPPSNLDFLAFEAAGDSMLGSGIGIFGVSVALQLKGLPKGKNVSVCHAPSKSECRKIGANSARIIKKMALK